MTKKIIAITTLILVFAVGVGMAYASTSTDENLTLNGTFQFTTSPVNGYVLTSDGTGLASWAAGAVRLDRITAATALNTIANGVNAQTWNWALDGTDTAFTFGETTAATGAGNAILKINTLNTSTAQPLVVSYNAINKMYVSAEGNDLYLNANGVQDTTPGASTEDIAQLVFAGTASAGDFRITGDGNDIFWQGGGGRVLQMGSYHPTVISGDTQTSTLPDFISAGGLYSAASTIILPATGRTADKALVVRGIASQTGNLTEWQNSAGTILSSISSAGALTIGQSGTAILNHYSATASLDFGAIDGSCLNLTIAVTGAATGDTATATPTPVAGGIETDGDGTWAAYVSAANTVTVHVCDVNPAQVAFNPSAQTWRVDVWKH
jgi:hypothetical protein